jgi:hypothetical protein
MSYTIDARKLGVRISNMKLKGIEKGNHTKKGETKIYNINELKKHFKIGEIMTIHNKTDEEIEEIDF